MHRAICAGLFLAVSIQAQSPVTNTQLFVAVRPEAALAWQGNATVVAKARLAPGAQARVWADQSCAAPGPASYLISASGSYAISITDIDGVDKPMVCMSSTDGTLNASLAALH